jgi:two-component system sensor histidine kinase KdpD
VVANLVGNAVKAAGGRQIEIRARLTDSRVDLAIIDHGAGVLPADHDRIFAPFQRLNDRRADGGLGLGLAIARGFTEAMSGTVTPSDTPGGGLTMTVSLPLAEAGQS